MVRKQMPQPTDMEGRIVNLEKTVKKNRINSVTGANLYESTGGTVIEIPQLFVLGKITAHVVEGSSYTWKYTVVPVVVDGIRAVNTAGGSSFAYNLTELNNPVSGAGLHGNGIDNSAVGWPVGFTVQPCPVDTIVMLWPIQSIAGIRYIFSYANGVDGTC
jgi:hypothetical protein